MSPLDFSLGLQYTGRGGALQSSFFKENFIAVLQHRGRAVLSVHSRESMGTETDQVMTRGFTTYYLEDLPALALSKFWGTASQLVRLLAEMKPTKAFLILDLRDFWTVLLNLVGTKQLQKLKARKQQREVIGLYFLPLPHSILLCSTQMLSRRRPHTFMNNTSSWC